MYEIIFSKKAERFIDSLNNKERIRLITAIERLRIRPEAHLTKLIGINAYKFRVGDYRLIIDINKKRLQILVIKVGHRKNIYKNKYYF